MKRLIPILLLSSLLLSGAALAQSFEPPSISGLFGIPEDGTFQIDPPSSQVDVGPSHTNGDSDGDFISDLAEAQEAIASGISEALVTTAAGIAETANPQFLNPDFFNETDPGVALLEFLGAEDEEETDPNEGPIGGPIEAPKRRIVGEIVVVGSKGDPPDEIQGVVLKCEGWKAGGNPLEGLNLGGNKPKTKKQLEAEIKCKVVSK